MSNLSLKQKIIGLVVALGLILIAIAQMGFYKPSSGTPLPPESKSEEIQVVSTSPSPLDEATILPTQTLEFTFNYALENTTEFKHSFDPKFTDYDLKLTNENKTIQIIPKKPFTLGMTYTFAILPDTKFEGKRVLKDSKTYHFKTIEYRGV